RRAVPASARSSSPSGALLQSNATAIFASQMRLVSETSAANDLSSRCIIWRNFGDCALAPATAEMARTAASAPRVTTFIFAPPIDITASDQLGIWHDRIETSQRARDG